MLQKIISIKNIGRFLGFEACSLSSHTLIFGENGVGKSTLCAILRALKSGDPDHITGRKTRGSQGQPAVELLLNGNENIKFENGKWLSKDGARPSPYPDLAIFDDDFVTENVHAAGVVEVEQRRGLLRVIIGEEGVRLEKKANELAEKIEEKKSEITEERIQNDAQGIKGVDFKEFIKLPEVSNIEERISKQKLTVATARNAESIRKQEMLSEIKIPTLPENFKSLLTRTIDDIAKDAQKRATDHVAVHKTMTRDWIAKGLEHLEHADDENCPFCGQDTDGLELIGAYRAVFSEGYKRLRKDITEIDRVIAERFGDRVIDHIKNRVEQNENRIEFWKKFCDFKPTSLAVPAEVFDAIQALEQVARSLLARKRGDILERIDLDEAFRTAFSAYENALTKVEKINEAIREINAQCIKIQCDAKKKEVSEPDVEKAEAKLARLRTTKFRRSASVDEKCNSYCKLDTKIKAVQKELRKLNKKFFDDCEKRINEHLNEDGFNTTFRIVKPKYKTLERKPETSYGLCILDHENKCTEPFELGSEKTPRNQPSFKNTLSSGDRSTLALAFFFFHLEQDKNLAGKTVVFDDPFGSQDASRRSHTVDKITEIAEECAQVIVLSHNVEFLSRLNHIWKKKKLICKKAPPNKSPTLELKDEPKQGTKIISWDIEDAVRTRNARNIEELKKFYEKGEGKMQEIILKPRLVLETRLRENHPEYLHDNLGLIISKISDRRDQHPAHTHLSSLKKINNYTSPYHHDSEDPINRQELKGYVKRTLKIIGALQASKT